MGTVIDPELSNQVRVTVVATGLGRPAASGRAPLTPPRDPPPTLDGRAREPRAPLGMSVVRRTPHSNPGPDYAGFDTPTVRRNKAVGDGLRSEPDPEELLDIPAFLRRQAD